MLRIVVRLVVAAAFIAIPAIVTSVYHPGSKAYTAARTPTTYDAEVAVQRLTPVAERCTPFAEAARAAHNKLDTLIAETAGMDDDARRTHLVDWVATDELAAVNTANTELTVALRTFHRTDTVATGAATHPASTALDDALEAFTDTASYLSATLSTIVLDDAPELDTTRAELAAAIERLEGSCTELADVATT